METMFIYYTIKSVYEVCGKLKEIINILETKGLFRVHRRYAINSEKVKAIDNQAIYTLTHEKLPFSKSFQYTNTLLLQLSSSISSVLDTIDLFLDCCKVKEIVSNT
ncbi:LytTR family transcriptional regulator DNA-binding domain-containing protein [Leeuwenhoekiella marinoflava]|uniref:LytTr DNA-binding domain-containing protein n=3 Tax=Leeuwenhoekiella marinoflava TaxID=988 RepID=A0A4Q0PP24_9FLAO|nr:LytTr DNA-binding domain-containing protein [Leeuwenhoekiella marinoflava]SHE78935.1 LytTr DNA-binding domain-containing protein [Leeuwenhoekiella marinoflava DSM 3653]